MKLSWLFSELEPEIQKKAYEEYRQPNETFDEFAADCDRWEDTFTRDGRQCIADGTPF